MIRALRRWLLGVEPEGPPLLSDPLYCYEARRYWTVGRYAFTIIALIVWTGLATIWLADGGLGHGAGDEPFMLALWLVLLCRAPLSFMVSTGAALCVVPERASGQLEQFILTPVDSWRFCLARLAGRLRGLFAIWLWVVPVLLAIAVLVGLEIRSAGDLLLAALIILFGQIDLAAMLVVDAAVGMRYTAISSNTALALVRTYLVNFVLTPTSMFLGASVGAMAGAVAVNNWRMLRNSSDLVIIAVIGSLMLLVRLGLAAVAIRLALRDARRAMEKTFYQPE